MSPHEYIFCFHPEFFSPFLSASSGAAKHELFEGVLAVSYHGASSSLQYFFKFIQCLCLFVLIFTVPGPSFLGITVNALVQDSSGV